MEASNVVRPRDEAIAALALLILPNVVIIGIGELYEVPAAFSLDYRLGLYTAVFCFVILGLTAYGIGAVRKVLHSDRGDHARLAALTTALSVSTAASLTTVIVAAYALDLSSNVALAISGIGWVGLCIVAASVIIRCLRISKATFWWWLIAFDFCAAAAVAVDLLYIAFSRRSYCPLIWAGDIIWLWVRPILAANFLVLFVCAARLLNMSKDGLFKFSPYRLLVFIGAAALVIFLNQQMGYGLGGRDVRGTCQLRNFRLPPWWNN
jgi:hypothetical protein